MKSFPEYKNKDYIFWAHVKFLSEKLGYSDRKTQGSKKYIQTEVISCFTEFKFNTSHLIDDKFQLTNFGKSILDYLNKRSDLLNKYFLSNFMNRDEARIEFEKLHKRLNPKCNLPLNKQKGEKKHYAFLSCIVNMLTEQTLGDVHFDDNPMKLATIVDKNKPIRVFSRRFDGAFPSTINPVAVWEIKEYYGTTTFGSRVADGVYETMLDGMEIEQLKKDSGKDVYHYLIIDDKFTWWDLGRSYLCRIIDILNQGYIDEVIVGRDVLKRWPEIVKSWS